MELTERKKKVLRSVVDLYIRTAEAITADVLPIQLRLKQATQQAGFPFLAADRTVFRWFLLSKQCHNHTLLYCGKICNRNELFLYMIPKTAQMSTIFQKSIAFFGEKV